MSLSGSPPKSQKYFASENIWATFEKVLLATPGFLVITRTSSCHLLQKGDIGFFFFFLKNFPDSIDFFLMSPFAKGWHELVLVITRNPSVEAPASWHIWPTFEKSGPSDYQESGVVFVLDGVRAPTENGMMNFEFCNISCLLIIKLTLMHLYLTPHMSAVAWSMWS